MKNNSYTRAMSAVKISGEALEAGLARAKASGDKKKGKVCYMKKYIVKAAAAAACVAVASGVVWVGMTGKTGNTITLTANAQEWEYGAAVEFGELQAAGGGFCALPSGDGFVAGAQSFTALPIRCEGKNIESVTYTLRDNRGENVEAWLRLGEQFASKTENDAREQDFDDYASNEFDVGSYTVAYEEQPYFGDNGMSLDTTEPTPVILTVGYRIDPQKLGLDDRQDLEQVKINGGVPMEWYDVMEELCDSELNDMRLDVTVRFGDGAEKTETIELDVNSGAIEYPNGAYYCMQVTGTRNAHE